MEMVPKAKRLDQPLRECRWIRERHLSTGNANTQIKKSQERTRQRGRKQRRRVWCHGNHGGGSERSAPWGERNIHSIGQDEGHGRRQRARSHWHMRWALDRGTGDVWGHREEMGTQDWALWASFFSSVIGVITVALRMKWDNAREIPRQIRGPPHYSV